MRWAAGARASEDVRVGGAKLVSMTAVGSQVEACKGAAGHAAADKAVPAPAVLCHA
jgi:hypothetical protein